MRINRTNWHWLALVVVLIAGVGYVWLSHMSARSTQTGTDAFRDSFSSTRTLEEAGSMKDSTLKNWWLNSGGRLVEHDGSARTLYREQPASDSWRKQYAASDPGETDDGRYPQNIFRLVTRSKWQNYRQTVFVKIDRYNESTDSHRDAANGILLFNRYEIGGQTLYYTGLRVDGTAVIKKKYSADNKKTGEYATMVQKPVYAGQWDRNSKPNLLPVRTWIGLRSEVINQPDGSVRIRLYTDLGITGQWQLVAEAIDHGQYLNGPALSQENFAGIRTDFMDAEFKNYEISTL